MSVYYRLDELNDNMNSGTDKVTGLYPRIINRRTVFLDELLRLATRNTTINQHEAKAVFGQILEQIFNELKDGNNVCIDDFGMFYLTAKTTRTEHVQTEEEIRSASIEVNRLVFRMSKSFLRRLGSVDFVRLPWNSPKRKKGSR